MDSDLTTPQTYPNTRSCLRIVTVCICADRNDVQREVPLFVFLFNKTLQTQPNGTVLGLDQVEGCDFLVFTAETRTVHLHTLLNNIGQS
jgi:DTW domain-containing protein YfiP